MKKIYLLILIALFACGLHAQDAEQTQSFAQSQSQSQKISPHNVVSTTVIKNGTADSCLSCHTEMPQDLPKNGRLSEVKRHEFHTDGIGMCSGCHDPASAKHMLGKFSPEQLPAHMALSKDGKVTCLTCHFMHGELNDTQPWANVGLFDRMFASEKLFRTYLLRENNANGELCLICHHADGYAEQIK